MYCDQTRNPFSCLILTAYCMSRSLRRDHSNVHVCRRNDLVKVNVKPMSKHQHITCLKVWLNGFLIQCSLLLIIDEDHDHICLLCSFCCCIYFESLLFSFFPGTGSLIQTNDDMASWFLCIQRMCMSLASISDHGYGLAIQCSQVTVILIINLCFWHIYSLLI